MGSTVGFITSNWSHFREESVSDGSFHASLVSYFLHRSRDASGVRQRYSERAVPTHVRTVEAGGRENSQTAAAFGLRTAAGARRFHPSWRSALGPFSACLLSMRDTGEFHNFRRSAGASQREDNGLVRRSSYIKIRVPGTALQRATRNRFSGSPGGCARRQSIFLGRQSFCEFRAFAAQEQARGIYSYHLSTAAKRRKPGRLDSAIEDIVNAGE